MASSSKKKTTFAKMNREAKVREKRIEKEAKKNARKQAAALEALEPQVTGEETLGETGDEQETSEAPTDQQPVNA